MNKEIRNSLILIIITLTLSILLAFIGAIYV